MRLIFVAMLVGVLSLSSQAQDVWPQFRGVGSQGIGEDAPTLPEVWSATENVVWKAPIPGLGWSCPIVWKDKIFLTTCVSEEEIESPKAGLYLGGERDAPSETHHWWVYCLDFKSGDVLWKQEVHVGIPQGSRHMKNSFASETPVTDGERVYAYFGNTGLFVFDMDGNKVWEKKFESVKTKAGWGTAASPVVHNGRLYIVNDNESKSYLVALDAKTGDEIWRVDRDEDSNWATPFIWETDKGTYIVTPGSEKNRAYDLDGKPVWELGGSSSITIPTAYEAHGMLILASGFVMDSKKPVWAVRPGATGDITLAEGQESSEFVAWFQPLAAPYNPSTLVYGDYFYVLYDRAHVACFNAKTGEEMYGKERLARGAAFTASPWAYNGKVFCLSEEGDTYVLEAGPEFKLVQTNSIGEMALSSPAIANGSLLLRTANHLFRLEKSSGK